MPPVPQNRHVYQTLRSRFAKKRTLLEKLADWSTRFFGSMTFFALNIAFFSIWILINSGYLPGFVAYDPFPFGFLTMILSIEAIILAILVLISQNRAAKIADLREEVDLYVNMVAERESTALLRLLLILMRKHGVNVESDQEIQELLKPLDLTQIENRFENEIE